MHYLGNVTRSQTVAYSKQYSVTWIPSFYCTLVKIYFQDHPSLSWNPCWFAIMQVLRDAPVPLMTNGIHPSHHAKRTFCSSSATRQWKYWDTGSMSAIFERLLEFSWLIHFVCPSELPGFNLPPKYLFRYV